MKKILFLMLSFFLCVTITSAAQCAYVTGDATKIGDEVSCGDDHFYVISNDGENIKMISKYNLLLGNDYYRVEFPTSYTNTSDIYLNKTVQEKVNEGYTPNNYFKVYDSDKEVYNYTGVLLRRSSGDTASAGKYVFFDEARNIEDALRDSRVKDFLSKGYNYSLLKLSSGKYIGVKFSKKSGYTYNVVIFDKSIEKKTDVFANDTVAEKLSTNYFDGFITDTDGKYLGVILYQQKGYEYKTIALKNETRFAYILEQTSVEKELQNGYSYDKVIPGDSKYRNASGVTTTKSIGVVLIKRDGYEYKTISLQTNEKSTTDIQFYNRADVKKLLSSGYALKEKLNWSNYNWVYSYIGYDTFGATFYKDPNYDYYNVMFGQEVTSSNLDAFVKSNSEIQAKIAEGYSISTYYKIGRYSGNITNGNSYYNYYGVRLLKSKKNSTASDPKLLEVHQSESAVGAHGDEAGKPDPEEIGILNNEWLDGSFSDYSPAYSTGYRDYFYTEKLSSQEGYYYMESYKNTLKNQGYDILDVDIITVSELNTLVKNITGEYLPLEKWYNEAEDERQDYVSGNYYNVLGSIKDRVPEEYSWIWSTTYWTRTVDPDWDNVYFVDTLGDLCSSGYCEGVVGAGLRPVVTIAVEDVTYGITKVTDGNGIVVAVESMESGKEVQFTVEAKEGYSLNSVKVTDENGNELLFTNNTFTMPSANVLIEATFVKNVTNPNTFAMSIIVFVVLGIIAFLLIRKQSPKLKWLSE